MGRGTDTDGFRKCIRLSMVIANCLVLLGALAVLAVGTWTIVDKSYMEVLLRNKLYMSAAYTLLAVGVATIILSFLGCFGSLKEQKILLLAYFIFVLLMFVVLLIGGLLAYVFRHQIAANMRPEMMLTIRQYNPDLPSEPITKAWDSVQQKLQCCGVETNTTVGRPWEAWKSNNRINSGSADKKVPESCCKYDTEGVQTDCASSTVDVNKIYTSDCLAAALFFVKGHAVVIGGVAVGFASVMIIGMALSICLYKLIS